MTTQRWPRTHERTNTRDAVKRLPAAEPKPWLTRRSVRHAPAPTALRVEPWDSEILRTLTGEDNACGDCGHIKCSCPENAIAPEPRCTCGQHALPAPVTGIEINGTKHTLHGPCYVLPEPAPKAGEREVRIGDVWSGAISECRYKVLTPGPGRSASAAECVFVPTSHGGGRFVGQRCLGVSLGELLSRAQPAAVDDGAVDWRDCATAEEALKAAGFKEPAAPDGNWTHDGGDVWRHCAQAGSWLGRRHGAQLGTHFRQDFRAAIAHALGESPRIARGPVPT